MRYKQQIDATIVLLTVVFLNLCVACFLMYLQIKKIGLGRGLLTALSTLAIISNLSKFIDLALSLRIASGHHEISVCAKSLTYAISHLILISTCLYNTILWIKFALTLECISKQALSIYTEMNRFLHVSGLVTLSFFIALYIVSMVNDCLYPDPIFDKSKVEYTVHFLAYLMMAMVYSYTYSYLNRTAR